MATPPPSTTPRIVPIRMAIEACKTDDVSLMAQAISTASSSDSRVMVHDVIQKGLDRSTARNATRVLSYLLDEQGADVSTVTASTMMANDEPTKPSYEMLEILIKHGWDINSRRPGHDGCPLLWSVTDDHDLVKWCLDHGARVESSGDTPPRDANGVGPRPRELLLEVAAASGTVETFELLRARGAPLSGRTLHSAVAMAAVYAPQDSSVRDALFDRQMEMVRHLVDIIKLDVDREEMMQNGSPGSPLCCVADRNNGKDARELIWFLLDRGADPDLETQLENYKIPSARETALMVRNARFLQAVEEWQARQHGGTE